MRNIFIFLILLIGCNPFSVDPSTIYWIQKGERYSTRKVSPVYSERVDFLFRFNESNLYLDELPKNNSVKDINKLYGLTSVDIHKNSARFGWRQKAETDSIELFAYWYINGVRGFKSIGIVPINKYYTYSIDVTGGNYVWEFDGYGDSIGSGKHIINDTKNILSFRAFPYFGGNNTAPHDMFFSITEI